MEPFSQLSRPGSRCDSARFRSDRTDRRRAAARVCGLWRVCVTVNFHDTCKLRGNCRVHLSHTAVDVLPSVDAETEHDPEGMSEVCLLFVHVNVFALNHISFVLFSSIDHVQSQHTYDF